MADIKYLIMEGGGTRAVIPGAMALQLDKSFPGLFTRIECLAGTSGSSGNIFYGLSHGTTLDGEDRYVEVTEYVWTNLLTREEFVSKKPNRIFSRKPIMDISYLCHVLFKKHATLREYAIRKTTQGWIIPTYCTSCEQTVFVCNDAGEQHVPRSFESYVISDKDDIYQVLAAAKAAPVLSNESFALGKHTLIDGALEFPIPSFEFEGYGIVLLSSSSSSFFEALKTWMTTFCFGILLGLWKADKLSLLVIWKASCRKFIRRKKILELRELEKLGRVLILEPISNIGSNSDNSPKCLIDNYNMARATIVANEQRIQEFLDSVDQADPDN